MATVLIFSPVRLYGEGVAACLAAADDEFECHGWVRTVDAALVRIAESVPDVVIVDMTCPDPLGAVAKIQVATGGVEIIALAVREERPHVVACAKAGITGYVGGDATLDDLRAAIRSCLRGELACTPRIARGLLDEIQEKAAPSRQAPPSVLSARESEIIELVDRGMSNKEIARRLHIGVSTVKNHVHSILRKLKVGGRGEAAAVVRESGWLVTRGF